MQQLWIHPSATETFAAAAIRGYDDAIAHLGVDLPAATEREVLVTPLSWRLPGGAREVFFKIYLEPRASLRFLGRASKALREVQSYQAFERLGIRSPRWIACGEHRDRIGRLRSAFIVTEAVPESSMLDEFLARRCPPLVAASRALRQEVLEQLAGFVRAIHEASFFHNDLHWRNILVNGSDTSPAVWWIDCPRGRFRRRSLMRRHYLVKDLACLDLGALEHCTRAERLRFVQHYLGRQGSQARQLARAVEAYRSRRWASRGSDGPRPSSARGLRSR